MGAVGKYLSQTLSGGWGTGGSRGLLGHPASSALSKKRGRVGLGERVLAFPATSVERECLREKGPQGQE